MTHGNYAILAVVQPDALVPYADALASALGDVAEFVNPYAYHITLAHGLGDLSHDMVDMIKIMFENVDKFPILIDGISQFSINGGDRFAIYLNVNKGSELYAIQQRAYDALYNAGLAMSATSDPIDWKPHITLCYSDRMIEPVAFSDPTAVTVDRLLITMQSPTEVGFTSVGNVDLRRSNFMPVRIEKALTDAGFKTKHPENCACGACSAPATATKTLYVAPQMNVLDAETVTPALHRSYLGRKDGRRYMFLVTSNGYKDREDEWIPTEELKRYVERSWVADDICETGNKHLFWHDPNVVIGDIVWADMAGGFLVEVSKEADTPLARAVWDYIEANPDIAWGTSHGFRYYSREGGVYAGVKKFETSTLPLNAAANLLTISEVIMSSNRDAFLNKMLGIDNAAELLKSAPEKITELLQARGVEAKSTDPAPAIESDEIKSLHGLIGELIVDLSALTGEVETIKAAFEAEKAKAQQSPDFDAKINKISDQLSEVAKLLEVPVFQAGKGKAAPADDPIVKQAEAELAQKGQRGAADNPFADVFSDMYD